MKWTKQISETNGPFCMAFMTICGTDKRTLRVVCTSTQIFVVLWNRSATVDWTRPAHRFAFTSDNKAIVSCRHFNANFYWNSSVHFFFQRRRLLCGYAEFPTSNDKWWPPVYGRKNERTLLKLNVYLYMCLLFVYISELMFSLLAAAAAVLSDVRTVGHSSSYK